MPLRGAAACAFEPSAARRKGVPRGLSLFRRQGTLSRERSERVPPAGFAARWRCAPSARPAQGRSERGARSGRDTAQLRVARGAHRSTGALVLRCGLELVARAASLALLVAHPPLVLDAPSLGGAARACGPARRRWRGERGEHQLAQLLSRILEVPRLVPVALALDVEPPLAVEAPPREGDEARAHRLGQHARRREVEDELDLRRYLVDVLATGAARAHGRPRKLRGGQRDTVVDDEGFRHG